MENINEISPMYLGEKVWYSLTKEEQGKYNQTVAPAFIVRGWINEYSQEENPEYRVGLNLKVMLDNHDMIQKFSVKRCKEDLVHEPSLDNIPHGEYLYHQSLLHLDRRAEYMPEYGKQNKKAETKKKKWYDVFGCSPCI